MARSWPRPWQSPRALTASVSVVTAEQRKKVGTGGAAKWQEAAWDAYDNIGEVKHAARYAGRGLARCRYFVGTRKTLEDDLAPIDPETSSDIEIELSRALERVRGRDGTFASLARSYGIQQFVGGDSLLVGLDGDLRGETWEMLSPQEVRKLENGGYRRATPGGEEDDFDDLPENAFVLRMWQRHPKIRDLPDSPLRGVLDVCESLRVAQAVMTSLDRSRLILSGLALLPSEAELPPVEGSEDNGGRRRLQLLDEVFEAAMASMEDPGSAASALPIFLEMKADMIEKVKHVTFDRQVDEKIAERIAFLIRRFAQGIDLPIEVVVGLADSNHWSAWTVIQEAAVAYVGPVAAQFCEDLTAGLLVPIMTEMGIPHDEQWRYAVGFDPSDLTVNPNRFQDTLAMHGEYIVSDAYMRDVAGVPETAAPNAAELNRRLLMASGMPVTSDSATEQDDTEVTGPGEGVSGDRTAPEGDGTGPAGGESSPAQTPGPANTHADVIVGRVVGAAEMAVESAMNRAGAKIRTTAQRHGHLRAFVDGKGNPTLAASLGEGQCGQVGLSADVLLDGAWETLEPRLVAWVGRRGATSVLACLDEVARSKLWKPDAEVAPLILDATRRVVATRP